MGKEKELSTPLTKRTWKTRFYDNRFVIIAFFLPFLLFGIGFAVNKVSPFGDQQILVVDNWQQYFPFMLDFQSKLKEGSSVLYSWGIGLGTNYIALIAYYLASPLNLLFVFVPQEFLQEYVTFALLVKIGCAGGFFSILLRSVFKRHDFSIAFFSLLYALCAFTMGYYWNVMWFDTFALLPLLVLGTISLVTRGKYKMFVISLALSMLTNYYIGFFSCVFVILVFIATCIIVKTPIKKFLTKFLQIGGFAILGLGLGCLLMLPAYIALQNTFAVDSVWPAFGEFYDWRYNDLLKYLTEIFANFDAFAKPAEVEGLPNIYCGFICVLLMGVFFSSKKISFREKTVSIGLLVFLLICCVYKLPNFIIHGLHLPNQIPYRFSFLISFVVVFMAYRAFLLLKDVTYKQLFGMSIIGIIFIVFAYASTSEQHTDLTFKGTIALCVAYLAIILLYILKVMNVKLMQIGIFALILVEIGSSVFIGIETVRTTSRNDYPDMYDDITSVRERYNSEDDELFYRESLQKWYSFNDTSLYGYKGASVFSSTVNGNVTTFLAGLGVRAWDIGNSYTYHETLPTTNAYLDIKYLVGRYSQPNDKLNWEHISSVNNASAYKNTSYLSLGFMTNKELAEYDHKLNMQGLPVEDPLEAQQSFFTKATGVTEDLFTDMTFIEEESIHENVETTKLSDHSFTYTSPDATAGTANFIYEVPKDGIVYVYSEVDGMDNIHVTKADEENASIETVEMKRGFIYAVGEYKAGDKIKIYGTINDDATYGNLKIHPVVFNQDVFRNGYDILSDELLNVEKAEATCISGTINVKNGGLMYTSIPYEKGWTAKVDGESVDIVPIDNAMCALELAPGTHTVEFNYVPDGFMPALAITIVSLVVFVALILIDNKKKKEGSALMQPFESDFSLIEEEVNEEKDKKQNVGQKKKKKKKR